MPKKIRILVITLLGVTCFGSQAVAQEVQPTPSAAPVKASRKPIVSKWTTLKGIRYFHEGQELKKLEDYSAVISPLHDPECDRLLNLSGSSETTGVVFLVGGGAVLLGGVAIAASDPNRGTIDGQQTVGLITVLVGVLGDYLGAFKLAESKTSRFNAVQRYNAIIHGDDLEPLTLQKPGIQADLLAFDF